MHYLFDDLAKVRELFRHGSFGLITDVDGTISHIVPSPEFARVSPPCKRHLRRLSSLLPLVAAISGRPAAEARRLVGIPAMLYAGNHGLEWWEKGRVNADPLVQPFRRPLEETLSHLRAVLDEPGVIVEDKGVTASIHYRMASDHEEARRTIVEEVAAIARSKGLWVTEGRMVVEIRPPVNVNKGTAVMRLVEVHSLRSVLYLGDDVTDLDAFAALRSWQQRGGRSLSVAVVNPESGERLAGEADVCVNGVGDVEALLGWLATEASRLASTGLQADGRATL